MSEEFDMSAMIQADSDQLNNIDLPTEPVVVTITAVSKGPDLKRPINLHTDAFGDGRPYRPNLTMRRVLSQIWGDYVKGYVGRSLAIYRDPKVTFGRDQTGGIRISAASHISGRMEISLPVSRAKYGRFTIEPLAARSQSDLLRAEWKSATPERRAEIEAEVKALEELS